MLPSRGGLADHIRLHRFDGSDALTKARAEFEACRGKTGARCRCVVIHGPYPSADDGDENIEQTGHGSGKTDLLELLQEELGNRDDCHVFSFLENRERIDEHFYHDVFLSELIEKNPALVSGARILFSQASDIAYASWNRACLFVSCASALLFSVLVAIFTVNCAKFVLEFVRDPKNKDLTDHGVRWLEDHQSVLIWASVGLFLVWVMQAWNKAQTDDKWTKFWIVRSRDELLKPVQERLRNNQEAILKHFGSRSKTMAVLVDDVDSLDGDSFQNLIKLYEAAAESKRYSLFLLLAYNPRNVKLHQPERMLIARELEQQAAAERGYAMIPLQAPGVAQVIALLWSYYQDERIEGLVHDLRRTYSEASANPNTVLSFFASQEAGAGDGSVFGMFAEELHARFEQHLNRDRRIASDILDAVQKLESHQECFELLKYLLAFRSNRIPERLLKSIVKTLTPREIDDCAKALSSESIQLLQTVLREGTISYEFRRPYLRGLLSLDWQAWRADAQQYSTFVFEGLHSVPNLKDSPVLAFGAAPSPLSIDVLWREGEYYFNYYGSSDAGYALKFYSLQRGGALGKWVAQCDQAEDSALWDLVYWKSEARHNPYREISRKQYPAHSFAPDLVLTAGRLYWMDGDCESARTIWDELWPSVRNRLAAPPKPELGERLIQADAEIRLALARMLYWRGAPGDWPRVLDLCGSLVSQTGLPQATVHRARLLLVLMKYYQSVGVGDVFPNYQFLNSLTDRSEIREICDDIPGSRLERARCLHVWAESLWPVLSRENRFPGLEIALEYIEPSPPLPAFQAEFGLALEEMMKTLEAVAASRRKAKFPSPEGGRVQEGDLLFWEGVYYLHRARQFCLYAWQLILEEKELLSNQTSKAAASRFEAYYSIARRLSDFCIQVLLEHRTPSGIAKLVTDIEKANEDRELPEGWAAMSYEKETRKNLELLYAAGWRAISAESQERFQLAEAVYRRLGSTPGIAAVHSMMATVDRQFANAATSFSQEPKWVVAYGRFVRHAGSGMGAHLDALTAHLKIADWSGENDVPRAIAELRSAEKWAAESSLGLPQLLCAEIRFSLANHLGNLAQREHEEEAIGILRMAAAQFEASQALLNSIGIGVALERLVTCHWWMAELHTRRADRLPDGPAKESRKQALAHCDAIRKHLRGSARWLNKARSIEGRVLPKEGKLVQGFQTLELAYEYFREEHDRFETLQSLTLLAALGGTQASEPEWKECQERCRTTYYGSLLEAAEEFRLRLPSLTSTERIALIRACRTLAAFEILAPADPGATARFRLKWLQTAFDLYESMNLFGHAIMLGESIRDQYRRLANSTGLEQQAKRILHAARRFDRTREATPAGMSRIVIECEGMALPSSPHADTKQAAATDADSLLRNEPVDVTGAIQVLEDSRSLMNEENPEDVDLEVLQLLRSCYYRIGEAAKAEETDEALRMRESVKQSRDFLLLASHYEEAGEDYMWALKMAADANIENKFALEAKQRLFQLRFHQASQSQVA